MTLVNTTRHEMRGDILEKRSSIDHAGHVSTVVATPYEESSRDVASKVASIEKALDLNPEWSTLVPSGVYFEDLLPEVGGCIDQRARHLLVQLRSHVEPGRLHDRRHQPP